jgi:hypothetical protein
MRGCVDGGVGTGTPGSALGGGPGGQGGQEPEGGGGAGSSNNRNFSEPTDAGVASASTSSPSTTTDCEPIAPDDELGAVGEFNWLHDTIVKAASAVSMKGAINRGDVNDIGNSLKSSLVGFPTILRQKVNHDLRPNPA